MSAKTGFFKILKDTIAGTGSTDMAGISNAVAPRSSPVSVTLQIQKSDCRKPTGSHNGARVE
jgi:hypothetical protein